MKTKYQRGLPAISFRRRQMQAGEIATLLALAIFAIVGISTLAASSFLSKTNTNPNKANAQTAPTPTIFIERIFPTNVQVPTNIQVPPTTQPEALECPHVVGCVKLRDNHFHYCEVVTQINPPDYNDDETCGDRVMSCPHSMGCLQLRDNQYHLCTSITQINPPAFGQDATCGQSPSASPSPSPAIQCPGAKGCLLLTDGKYHYCESENQVNSPVYTTSNCEGHGQNTTSPSPTPTLPAKTLILRNIRNIKLYLWKVKINEAEILEPQLTLLSNQSFQIPFNSTESCANNNLNTIRLTVFYKWEGETDYKSVFYDGVSCRQSSIIDFAQ